MNFAFPSAAGRARGIRSLLHEIDGAAVAQRRSRLLQTLANALESPIIVEETVIHPRRDD